MDDLTSAPDGELLIRLDALRTEVRQIEAVLRYRQVLADSALQTFLHAEQREHHDAP